MSPVRGDGHPLPGNTDTYSRLVAEGRLIPATRANGLTSLPPPVSVSGAPSVSELLDEQRADSA